MMTLIRQHLLSDAQLMVLLDNKPAIYQVEKPKDIVNDTYIVFLNKPLSGGYIRDWQIEFRVISKDLSKLTAIQSRLIHLLDNPREYNHLKNNEVGIRKIKLLNGGGTLRNPSTNNFELIVFFLCTI